MTVYYKLELEKDLFNIRHTYMLIVVHIMETQLKAKSAASAGPPYQFTIYICKTYVQKHKYMCMIL